MKNITLSIPEDLLEKSREYALRHGTSLNEFIRNLLRKHVIGESDDPVQKLISHTSNIRIQTKDNKWNRSEIYDRKSLS
ncbi:MAG: DUF6364 family protein [Bacteroidia bacterium]